MAFCQTFKATPLTFVLLLVLRLLVLLIVLLMLLTLLHQELRRRPRIIVGERWQLLLRAVLLLLRLLASAGQGIFNASEGRLHSVCLRLSFGCV